MRWNRDLAVALAVMLAFAAGAPCWGREDRADRPNVILCMADDQGWGDAGYQGHPVLKTPNLDAMAASGIRFNRFYAASAVCSPTRGSCLTGRHPQRYGITSANVGHLRAEEITLAEVLKELGYATGHFGKWHLGTMSADYSGRGPGRRPHENHMSPGMAGFEEWFSTEFAVATWDPYDPANQHLRGQPWDARALYWHNGEPVEGPQKGCDSKLIMDRALEFIESAAKAERPFFAVIWFHAPHEPVIGGEAYRARYADRPENEQHYYATITAMDEQIGRLRATLRELGVAENTMLWYASDNGPEGTPQPRGRNQGSAGGLRGRKRSLYEGGIRVPALLEWPAKIAAPRQVDVPCVTSDYFPTVLAALGQPLPADVRPYDGMNLMPLIERRMVERPSPIAFDFAGAAALVDNRFKLVHDPREQRRNSDNGTVEPAEYELYDLLSDPSESVNIAEENRAIVESMKERLAAWRASRGRSLAGADY